MLDERILLHIVFNIEKYMFQFIFLDILKKNNNEEAIRKKKNLIYKEFIEKNLTYRILINKILVEKIVKESLKEITNEKKKETLALILLDNHSDKIFKRKFDDKIKAEVKKIIFSEFSIGLDINIPNIFKNKILH